MKEVV